MAMEFYPVRTRKTRTTEELDVDAVMVRCVDHVVDGFPNQVSKTSVRVR